MKREKEYEKMLIRKSLEEDLEAFGELIDEHAQQIYSISFQILGNHADAENMLQETFIKAYRFLKTFKGESKFCTWLCRLTINLCINYKKKQGRMVVLPPEAIESLNNEKEEEQNNNPHQTQEICQSIRAAIDSLNGPFRRAMVLVAFQGLSHREAAEIEGCSEGTISWRIYKARQYLREKLGDVLDNY
jgi:RNA polymerase sigma-70 factor (ECF subfamily)